MVGRVITGKFKILQRIDTGGMGSVFKADDPGLSRTVAIKKINPELAGDSEAMERFKLEAKALAQLANGNVATIYDFVMDQGEPFLVMEFVEGFDLHKLIEEQGALPVAVAAPLFCGVLRGFAAIHGKNIVHRDIKPKNVIVSLAGEPKIIDFGIARMAGRSGVTQFGHTLGTPAYMSPEQVLGEALDKRSDLYSLAVVLFEMLTGAPPFREGAGVTVQKAHLEVSPPFLSSKVKGLPGKLDAILAKGLAKKPDKRYQTADEFLHALESALPPGTCSAKTPVQAFLAKLGQRVSLPDSGNVPPPTEYAAEAAPETRFETSAKEGARRKKPVPWLWVAVAAVCLLVVGIAIAVFSRGRGHSRPRTPAPMVQTAPPTQPPANAGQPPSQPDQSAPAAATPLVGTAPAATPPAGVAPAANPPVAPASAPKADAAKTGQADHSKAGNNASAGQAPAERPAAKKAKPVDAAEKARIDALKALGEYTEDTKK